MESIEETARRIDQRRVEMARRQTPGQKVAAGLRLYGQVKKRMIGGIRARYPDADEAQVREHLKRWLAMARENENQPWTN